MIVLNLTQGTPEWEAHRARHHNASDAPAMLGVSPHKTRAQLVREHAGGIAADVDEATQRRFDDGHRFEALARPLAEKLIGEDLFPCVGVLEGTRYSASFDGLTMLYDTAFEHKSLNDAIRNAVKDGAVGNAACLPEYLRVQMEQQCMVSGAERVLFMASKWNGDTLIEERHCWYYPDVELRARIVAGWEQFEKDVAAYVPEVEVLPPAAGRAPDQLPALRVDVQGMVTFSNLAEFKAGALASLGSINRDLQTDADFADAEQTVKWAKGVEEQLESVKARALSQAADIEAVFRTIDEVAGETRRVRLELDKLVKARKESIKGEIVAGGAAAVRAHYDAMNATLGAHAFQPAQTLQMNLGAAIKGLRSIKAMRDAIDAAVAGEKIEASQRAERVRACIAILQEHANEHRHLFADAVQLCATKAPEDLRNLVTLRIAEHQQREDARIEAEREKIRKEEADRLEREQREREAQAERDRAAAEAAAKPAPEPPAPAPVVSQPAANAPAPAAAPPAGKRIRLGEINAAIAPLSVNADGLAQLGFQPVGTERAAKLYAADQFQAICTALANVLRNARLNLAEAA